MAYKYFTSIVIGSWIVILFAGYMFSMLSNQNNNYKSRLVLSSISNGIAYRAPSWDSLHKHSETTNCAESSLEHAAKNLSRILPSLGGVCKDWARDSCVGRKSRYCLLSFPLGVEGDDYSEGNKNNNNKNKNNNNNNNNDAGKKGEDNNNNNSHHHVPYPDETFLRGMEWLTTCIRENNGFAVVQTSSHLLHQAVGVSLVANDLHSRLFPFDLKREELDLDPALEISRFEINKKISNWSAQLARKRKELCNLPLDAATPTIDTISRVRTAIQHNTKCALLLTGGETARFSAPPADPSTPVLAEAHQMAIVAASLGVPSHSIIFEAEAKDTASNARLSAELIGKLWDFPVEVVVVSKAEHLKWAMAYFNSHSQTKNAMEIPSTGFLKDVELAQMALFACCNPELTRNSGSIGVLTRIENIKNGIAGWD